jgi:triphosphatase
METGAMPTDETAALEARAPKGSVEELCLTGDESSLKLARQLILGSALPRAQRIEEVYLDTPDGALLANSIRYCVTSRRDRFFARIDSTSNEQLAEAPEFEVSGLDVDLAQFPDAVSQTLRDAIGEARLEPDFNVSLKRRGRSVVVDKMTVHCSWNVGQIRSSGLDEKISELSLTLLRGDPGSFYDWVAALLQKFDLHIEMRTGYERGVVISGRRIPVARRGQTPTVTSKVTVDELIVAVLAECLQHLAENWKLFASLNSPDSIHQMRVTLRRLRTALAIFNRSFPNDAFSVYREEAKNIATALGRAREIDVFRVDLENGPMSYLGQDASFDALLAAMEAERHVALKAAHEILFARQTSVFFAQMNAFVARRGWRSSLGTSELSLLVEPASIYAAEVLDRLDGRALKRGRKLMRLAPEERHALRITLKNLRYAAEFFGSMFDADEMKKYVRIVARLQDSLGAYNDAFTAHTVISRLEARGDSTLARAAGVADGWFRRGVLEADQHLGDVWNSFRRSKHFW